MAKREESDLVRFAGMFGRESKAGDTFWTGRLRPEDVDRIQEFLDAHRGGCDVIMFKNKKEGGPVLTVFVKPPYQRPDETPA